MPHNTIRIEIVYSNMVLFNMIHVHIVKSHIVILLCIKTRCCIREPFVLFAILMHDPALRSSHSSENWQQSLVKESCVGWNVFLTHVVPAKAKHDRWMDRQCDPYVALSFAGATEKLTYFMYLPILYTLKPPSNPYNRDIKSTSFLKFINVNIRKGLSEA